MLMCSISLFSYREGKQTHLVRKVLLLAWPDSPCEEDDVMKC